MKKIYTGLVLILAMCCVWNALVPMSAGADGAIYCPNCGKQIAANSKFCMFCGVEIAQYLLPAETGERVWSNIADVAAGEGYTIGLREDGSVVYAGADFSGAGRRISAWTDIERIEVSGEKNYVIGYRKDGRICIETLYEWGPYSSWDTNWAEMNLTAWTDIRKAYIGNAFCLGLKNDGTVLYIAADADAEDKVRDVSRWNGIVQLATNGYDLAVGLKADGTVVTNNKSALAEQGAYWGSSWGNESGWNNIRQLVNRGTGIYAIKRDGTVLGMLRPGWTDIESLYIAADSMFGLRRDGTVATDYSDYYSDDPRIREVSTWKHIDELGFDITAIGRFLPVGLCRDGTVCAITSYSPGEPYGKWDFSGWSRIDRLYSGTDFTIGIRTDGTVLVTGGEFETLDYLDEISKWTDIKAIFAGHGEETDHIIGLKKDGTVVAAGDNSVGQCEVFH